MVAQITATTDEINTLDTVVSTPTKLNIMDGVTATTAELNRIDVSAGTSVADKALVTDDSNHFTFEGNVEVKHLEVNKDRLKLNSTVLTTTAAELNLLDGATFSLPESEYINGITTIGSSQESKALVTDSNEI